MDVYAWIMLFLAIIAGIGTFLTWKSNKKRKQNSKS